MSDIDPELRDEYDFSNAKRGAVVSPEPGKTRVIIYLDNEVLDWFRAQVHAAGGGSYQTLINEALKIHIQYHDLEEMLRRIIREELHRAA